MVLLILKMHKLMMKYSLLEMETAITIIIAIIIIIFIIIII